MVAKYRLPPARDAFSVLVDNRRRSGIMSKVANLDRRFRVEAMRKFFSIRRCTSADRRGGCETDRYTRSPCANSRVIFSRVALNMLPRARMVITAIYCRSMSSFYADTEIRSRSHAWSIEKRAEKRCSLTGIYARFTRRDHLWLELSCVLACFLIVTVSGMIHALGE